MSGTEGADYSRDRWIERPVPKSAAGSLTADSVSVAIIVRAGEVDRRLRGGVTVEEDVHRGDADGGGCVGVGAW